MSKTIKHRRRKPFGKGVTRRHILPAKGNLDLMKAKPKKLDKVPAYKVVKSNIDSQGSGAILLTVKKLTIPDLSYLTVQKVKHEPLKLKVNKPTIDGYRIINLESLQSHVIDVSTHSVQCAGAANIISDGKEPVSLVLETHKFGLSSVLHVRCNGCGKLFLLNTSPKQPTSEIDINVRAVWGTMSSGGGASNLNELMGTMGCPNISTPTFSEIENKIGYWWSNVVEMELKKAGAEEKRMAIERDDYHQGVPAITVVTDGGWCKRTHKHSYNAAGGVAVIFGAETKKLLYLGVRNKTCGVCRKAENGQSDPPEHDCFKNWSESSQSMESDMIVEGFLKAEEVHGLRYMRIVADGDSSTYSNIQQTVPVWGPHVQKLECANHVCKCLRANLEKLVVEKPNYKGKGKLSKRNIVRLTMAVRCAIKMRSGSKNHKQLSKDIKNSISHILGYHEHCSDFCVKRPNNSSSQDNEEGEVDIEEDVEELEDIVDQQSQFWTFTSDGLEEARCATQKTTGNHGDIIRDVSVFLNRIAAKSTRLIGNFTTNLAEGWMSIRAKFDGGKRVNRCQRGSWNARCCGAALRKNYGPDWSPQVFEKVCATPAGCNFQKTFRARKTHCDRTRKHHQKEEVKDRRKKRKIEKQLEGQTKRARKDYGPNVKDDSNDISTQKLSDLCTKYKQKVLNKSHEAIQQIEINTRSQSKSSQWHFERKIRITSSNFGKVIKRKPTNISTALVKSLLYCDFKGNIHTVRGLAQERNTIMEYKKLKPSANVEPVGLVIDENNTCLAASTDGKVTESNGETGLIEIKNVLQTNQLSLEEACTKVKSFCLQRSSCGEMTLKQNHAFFYQCQGQLNIMNYEWLDFVVRRTDPYQINIQRIYRNKTLWNEEMVPKLITFYEKFILPELALPRYGTATGIRQPPSPWFTNLQEKAKSKRGKKEMRVNTQVKPSDA